MKYTVYLDVCCFNRPYDDQLQPLIRVETEAKLLIQAEIVKGNLGLVWSFILHYENNDNPYVDRRNQIAQWEAKATVSIPFKQDILLQAEKFMSQGINTKDALHIACATAAKADYFVTTDKKLLNKEKNYVRKRMIFGS